MKNYFLFEQYLAFVFIISAIFIALAFENIKQIDNVKKGFESVTNPLFDFINNIKNKLGLDKTNLNDNQLMRYLKIRKDICIALVIFSFLTILLSLLMPQFTLVSFPLQVIIYIIFENASIF